MIEAKIYNVLNKNREIIFTGNANEIGRKFGRDPETVRFCFKNGQRLCYKYLVEELSDDEKKNKEYIELRWHIKNYGNTITLIEPSYFLKKFEEEGIKVSSKKIGREWLLERC